MKKSSLTRPALALALALGLSACGGKASFPITVTVFGLQYGNLVVGTNGQELTFTPKANPTADDIATGTFAKSIEYGEQYSVEPKKQPPHQRCVPPGYDTATDNSIKTWADTAGHLATINVQYYCSVVASTIGGKISGLTADGLVLINGTFGGGLVVAKDATSFTMPQPVPYNQSYGVTVLTNPKGLICTVQNGTGVMGQGKDIDEAVTNISVTCDPDPNAPPP
ncbi:hypothetical protein [Massilia horti]|uniref:Lipoprotein n=1 Tax=Massilia horti TaxID=2562153 RepID=A0A4Y9SZJ3_9BURK|nr:hypothetical protein [Massilia horti]TFW32156.1 hypothetical protein E4O92_10780 [Massilia horti]